MMNIFRTRSSERSGPAAAAMDVDQVMYSKKKKPQQQKRTSRREKQLSSSSTLKTVDTSTHTENEDDSGFWTVHGEEDTADDVIEFQNQEDILPPSSVPQFRTKWTRRPRNDASPPSSTASLSPTSSTETVVLAPSPSGLASCIWIDDDAKSDEERILEELHEQIEVLTLSPEGRKKRSSRRSFAKLFGTNSY